jgi:hypothetical protein
MRWTGNMVDYSCSISMLSMDTRSTIIALTGFVVLTYNEKARRDCPPHESSRVT